MRLRRWLSLILLAAALVMGQQGAAVHALSHIGEALGSQQDKQAPHNGACDQCVAYADLGSALPAGDAIPPALQVDSAVRGIDPARPASPELRLPRARDPPILL